MTGSVNFNVMSDLSPLRAAHMLVLKGRLLDGSGAPALEKGMLVLQGERVLYAGPEIPIPEGSAVLDLPDCTLLPGLMDLHVHSRPQYLSWFLAAGVTTLRDACMPLEMLSALGQVGPARPNLIYTGPLLDGPHAVFQNYGEQATWQPEKTNFQQAAALIVETEAQARHAVRLLAEAGVHWIKLYDQLSLETVTAAVEEARTHGLPVVADLGIQTTRAFRGSEVDVVQVLDLGIRTIEHMSGYAMAYHHLGGDLQAAELDPELVQQLAELTIEHGLAVVPTLILQKSFLPNYQPAPEVPMSQVDDVVRGGLNMQWGAVGQMRDQLEPRASSDLRLSMALVGRIHELGGQVGAGTDTPAGCCTIPGGALHEELELLVQCGLTPMDALKCATSTAASILQRPELGVLAAGKLADVLVVQGKPDQHIQDTRNVQLVVSRGNIYSAAELQAQALREGERVVKSWNQDA